MTTQPRIRLDDLTSDALDQLYDRAERLEAGARVRSALLEEARDALETAGAHGDDWPRLVPAIEELARRADTADAVAEGNLRHVKQLITDLRKAEASVRELEAALNRVRALADIAPTGAQGPTFAAIDLAIQNNLPTT
ncbi:MULTISPECIES: hypothetical protein [unclassified Streptomyces]|uniref:hypothetical protein n=1 Tax=unclassified Streptomyces TaxID=2593676 RepID=UPI0008057B94|nr:MULTISPECIES: hypothetical protein [unclassified Streptomyces]MYR76560.1 hypothetical protein [Streptomyces sp. SID4925]SBV00080.1 hypothetical protein YUMDRAFT_06329 [Streptomyces sp. OspMP-M45]